MTQTNLGLTWSGGVDVSFGNGRKCPSGAYNRLRIKHLATTAGRVSLLSTLAPSVCLQGHLKELTMIPNRRRVYVSYGNLD